MYVKSPGSCDVQRWDYKLREALTEMRYTTHEEWMLWILFRRETNPLIWCKLWPKHLKKRKPR